VDYPGFFTAEAQRTQRKGRSKRVKKEKQKIRAEERDIHNTDTQAQRKFKYQSPKFK
jgi:hypothetical protein